jgi:Zn-finger nucleic acid-binding protein
MSKEDLLLSSIKVNDIGKEKVRKCPICSKKMLKVWVGLNKRFLIDKCKKSDGLWFDKGELELVIADIDLQSESKILTLLKDIFKHNSN